MQLSSSELVFVITCEVRIIIEADILLRFTAAMRLFVVNLAVVIRRPFFVFASEVLLVLLTHKFFRGFFCEFGKLQDKLAKVALVKVDTM